MEMNLPDGKYDLGLAPTRDVEAKLIFRIKIVDGEIIDLDHYDNGLDWTTTIKFILKTGQCSFNTIKEGYKYLLLRNDSLL